jgi:hypothetical protein
MLNCVIPSDFLLIIEGPWTMMVDGTTSEFECSSFIPRTVTESSEESCKCCDELKLESTRMLLELKSALVTIKLL